MVSDQLGQHIPSGGHHTRADADDVALGWVVLLLTQPRWLLLYGDTRLISCLLFHTIPKQSWWLCY